MMDDEMGNVTGTVTRIAERATRHADVIGNEDAIKAVLITPLLAALGHDPANPELVRVGVRHDQARADYVVVDGEGRTTMLVAVVSNPEDSESQRARQLLRMGDDKPVAVLLTDGRRHRFHVMEDRAITTEPFLSFDLGDEIEEDALTPLSRSSFDLDAAIDAGRMTRPDALAWEVLVGGVEENRFRDALVAMLMSEGVTEGRAANAAITALARVGRVLRGEEDVVLPGQADGDERRRAMTGDEQAALEIVRSIVGERIDGKRIEARPAQSYLSVNLDKNNRRAICRLYFSAQSTRYIGTFVDGTETKHRISSYQDVVAHRAEIMARLRELDPGAFRDEDDTGGTGEVGAAAGASAQGQDTGHVQSTPEKLAETLANGIHRSMEEVRGAATDDHDRGAPQIRSDDVTGEGAGQVEKTDTDDAQHSPIDEERPRDEFSDRYPGRGAEPDDDNDNKTSLL